MQDAWEGKKKQEINSDQGYTLSTICMWASVWERGGVCVRACVEKEPLENGKHLRACFNGACLKASPSPVLPD